jgi:flagellar hook-associated protein 1
MANSISSALLVATSGLRAAQAGIDVVTRNVSGSQVEGYTRKSAVLESLALGDTNSGVRANEVTRYVNESLLRQLRTVNSATSRLNVEDDFLGRFETIFGKPGDDIAITAKIGELADAFRALSVSPDLGTSQFQVLSAAEGIVQNLNLVSQTIRSLREEADNAINESVTIVNDALAVTQDLNLQIATFRAQGRSTAELEDQRDLQINRIAKEIDISYFERENGEIWISTKSGQSILDGAYSKTNPPLAFVRSPVILPTSAYYPASVSTVASGVNGLLVRGTDVTQDLNGGRIAGYLNIRDEFLPTTEAQLDELAAKMMESFSFNDLQLFRDGTAAMPTNLQAQSTAVAGATTIEVSDVTDLAVGMRVHFANQDSTYQITAIDSLAVPPTFDIEKVGATTGLDSDVPAYTNITFGPAIPQITNSTAAVVGAGIDSATALSITSSIGVSAGMRIKFANHDTIYTVTHAGPATAPPDDFTLTAGQFLVQPDGRGTGLRAPISANEAISVLHPAPGICGLASRISVNPVVSNNPWRVRDGTRVDAPSTLTGNNAIPLDIISMFEDLQSFTKNTGLSTSTTLEGFAASAISFQAVRRQAVTTEMTSQTLIRDTFDQRMKNDSGVNVDQELAFMLEVQNSYAANARVISAIKEMLDELLNIR